MSRDKLWTFFPFSLLSGTVAYISLMNLLVWSCLSLDQTLIDFIVSIKFLLREMRTCQYIVVKKYTRREILHTGAAIASFTLDS